MGNSTWLNILKLNGTSRAGWPIQISNNANDYFSNLAPVLVDLDGDGKLEIVCPDYQRVLAFHIDGSVVAGWPATTQSGYWITGISAADVTGDGQPEIAVRIAGTSVAGEKTLLLDAHGAVMPGWPIETNVIKSNAGPAAIVDIDGDGKRDVIVGAGYTIAGVYSSLHAFNSEGQELPGFPKYVSNHDAGHGNTPLVADLDGDGLLEIAWLNFSGDLYTWDTATRAKIGNSDWPMSQHDPQHTSQLGHPVH
jgi:hypothetical protein